MRVALDATPLLATRTGVGAFVEGALSGLARRSDLELSAYCVSTRGWRRLSGVLPPGVAGRARPVPAAVAVRAWRRSSFPRARWVTGPADVVHGTNFVVPPDRGVATVVTVHDLTAVRFPELCTPPSLRYPGLVRRAVDRGAWVHTPSEFVAREVVELLGVPADRVRAVHHGLPALPEPAPGQSTVSVPYVLAIGAVEPRKGFPTLVEAFDIVADALPDLHLVIAGPPGWGGGAFERARDDSRHADRVVWLGFVDDARRSALLRDATVFAFPSVYEGFGLPPLEAMASGTPVVATAAGSLPEVLRDAARFVPPGDVEALAAALVELAAATEDGAEARRLLVDAGRRRVADLSWDACAAGLAGLYHDAAAAAGHVSPAGTGSAATAGA